MTTYITTEQFNEFLTALYDVTVDSLTDKERANFTDVLSELAVQVLTPFSDGDVARSPDSIAVENRSWYVRRDGGWRELPVRLESLNRVFTDTEIQGWLMDGTLVQWVSANTQWVSANTVAPEPEPEDSW